MKRCLPLLFAMLLAAVWPAATQAAPRSAAQEAAFQDSVAALRLTHAAARSDSIRRAYFRADAAWRRCVHAATGNPDGAGVPPLFAAAADAVVERCGLPKTPENRTAILKIRKELGYE